MKLPTNKESLATHRKAIDNIDEQIIKLLAQRFRHSQIIGQLKKEKNLPIFQKEREEDIIKKRTKTAHHEGLDQQFAKDIFKTILSHSRRAQNRP